MANTYFTKHKTGKEARDAEMAGAKQVYDLVSTTLGPKGRNVTIHKGFDIEVLHDGLKVSRFVTPEDKFEQIGANKLREASEKHVAAVGDGTTLTTVLGYHIAREAMTLIDSGVNAMALIKGLEKGRDTLIDEVNKLSKPVETEQEKVEIATISAADAELGKMIGETYHKIGEDGVLVADESKQMETTLEHQEGISLDRGYLSWKFITDPKTMTSLIRDAYILLIDREFEDIYELVPFIEKEMGPKGLRNLVIIADDVKGTALASLIENKRQGLMNILCIRTPSFGKYKREMLEDIAIMTGGTVLDAESNKRISDLTLEDLGFAKVVKASKDSTVILENAGDLKKIEDRIAQIKTLLKDPDSEIEHEKLKERLARMTGGVYVIKTGGATELEMAERKERVEDAILATRAAIKGGIVPGGETTLLNARTKLKPSGENEEYAFRILQRAVEKPFAKLLENAGLNHGYYLAKLEDRPFGWGVDVNVNEIVDLVEEGIIDPTLVITEALRSAVSVAILLISSDGSSVIYEEKLPAVS